MASEATIFIVLEDVNDEIPLFTEREQETVMEGEPVGTPVTRLVFLSKRWQSRGGRMSPSKSTEYS